MSELMTAAVIVTALSGALSGGFTVMGVFGPGRTYAERMRDVLEFTPADDELPADITALLDRLDALPTSTN